MKSLEICPECQSDNTDENVKPGGVGFFVVYYDVFCVDCGHKWEVRRSE